MNEPYRAPDEVLKLEEQLREKSEECEDLRRELDEAEASARRDPFEERLKAEQWTWRIFYLVGAAVAISIAYFVWRYSMQPDVEGACRDVVIDVGSIHDHKCPYANQIMGEAKDNKVKCTCPMAPVGSVRP